MYFWKDQFLKLKKYLTSYSLNNNANWSWKELKMSQSGRGCPLGGIFKDIFYVQENAPASVTLGILGTFYEF